MAIVTRRYKFVGPTTASLQKIVGASTSVAVVSTFTGPIVDVQVDDALSSSITDLDDAMRGEGFVFDAAAFDLITAPSWTGDGSDGDVVIGAGTTTLTRDTYYNNLTIQNTGILNPAHYRVFVRNVLTINVGGLLACSGGAGAAAGAAGARAVGAAGTLAGQSALGGSGAIAAGNAGEAQGAGIQGFAGTGGAGGTGLGGVNAGGAAGALTIQATNVQGNPRALIHMGNIVGGNSATRTSGGTGGGGGGGNGAATGAGGGGGGGVIVVVARTIINNGGIQVHGGAGGSASNANAGGGGGGGGGLVVVTSHSYTGAAPTATAGAAGAGNGTGAAGAAGTAGLVIQHTF